MKHPTRCLLALATTLLLSAGVAQAGLFDDAEARKDIRELRAQADAQNKSNEVRMQKLEDSVRNIGIIQLLNQIEELNAEIARLRGQIEVLGNQSEQITKRQKDFYLDLDTRLRKLEATPGEQPVSTDTTAALAARPAGAAPGQDTKSYDLALNLFRSGDFSAAAKAFDAFTRDFPASNLLPNAQYWAGVSHFNLKDYARARAAQEALLRSSPDAPKAPDAMLAIASVQMETGDVPGARNTLETLITRYPASDAAIKARTRLPTLRK